MPSTRERSVTHISEIASADSMRTRVGSAKIEKNNTTLSSTSPSGTYSRTRSAVLLSNNIISCIISPLERAKITSALYNESIHEHVCIRQYDIISGYDEI